MGAVIGPELPDDAEALPSRPARLIAERPREFLRLNDDAVLALLLLGLLALVAVAVIVAEPARASTAFFGVAASGWTLLVLLALRGALQGVFVSRDGVIIRGVISNQRLPWDGLVVTIGPNPYSAADRSEWLLFSSSARGGKSIGGPGWRRTPGRVDARYWRFDEVADGLQRLATNGEGRRR